MHEKGLSWVQTDSNWEQQVVEVFSGEEELLTQTHEFKMQLDESSKKIDALRDYESMILGQTGDRVAESGGFDPCPFCAAALEHLRSERQNVLDHVKGLLAQREQLQLLMEKVYNGSCRFYCRGDVAVRSRR